MVKYLVDWNTWIQYLRRNDPAVATKFQAIDPAEIATCSIVLAELLYGALRLAEPWRARNLSLLATIRPRFASLPFDDPAAEAAARVRADLAAIGRPIGNNDLLIAAIALSRALTVVTHNTREFSRVAGLDLEDRQSVPPPP